MVFVCILCTGFKGDILRSCTCETKNVNHSLTDFLCKNGPKLLLKFNNINGVLYHPQICRFGPQKILVTYTDGQAVTNKKCKQFFNEIFYAKNWPKLLLNDNNINGYTIPKSVFWGHRKFLSRVRTDRRSLD